MHSLDIIRSDKIISSMKEYLLSWNNSPLEEMNRLTTWLEKRNPAYQDFDDYQIIKGSFTMESLRHYNIIEVLFLLTLGKGTHFVLYPEDKEVIDYSHLAAVIQVGAPHRFAGIECGDETLTIALFRYEF